MIRWLQQLLKPNALFSLAAAVDSRFRSQPLHKKNNVPIILTDTVISLDGKQAIRLRDVAQDPHRLGERLATVVLERGAAELLKAKA